MNNLFEQFQNHTLFQTLANKLDTINKYLSDGTYNEEQKESLLAYQQLLIIIQVNLSSKALPMINKSVLDNLNTSISNLSSGVLTNINNYPAQYNSVIDWYNRIPTLEKKSEIKESYNSLIDNFIYRQEKIEEKINHEVDKFILKQEHLTDLTLKEIKDFQEKQNEEFENWNSEKERMQDEINCLKEKNSNLQTQIDEFEIHIHNQENKINDLIENFKIAFNESSINFEERFSNREVEYNTKVDILLKENKNAADSVLFHLEKRKDEIEKLWGIIGQAAISGNSQNYANKARNMANILMILTLSFMAVGMTYIGVATIALFKGNYTYIDFVWKVITSAIILVPTFYTANLSKRQRDREFQLRDFEVKTACLEAFVESLQMEENQDEKNKLKLELTKAFFKDQYGEVNHNDCVLIPKEIAKIINTIAKKGNFNFNIGTSGEQDK